MRSAGQVYERAFEGWLIENRVRYVPIDQARRCVFARRRLKTFDFLVYRPDGRPVLAEVKGRRFGGASLAGLRGLTCWVTREDLWGLRQWQAVFAAGSEAVEAALVFAYRLEQIDVESDGYEVYDSGDGRYAFFVVGVEAYEQHMRPRSRRWGTVALPAAAFRRVAVEAGRYFLDAGR